MVNGQWGPWKMDTHASLIGLCQNDSFISHSSLHFPAPTYGFSSLAQLARFGFISHFTFEVLTMYSTL